MEANATEPTATATTDDLATPELHLAYAAVESLVAIFAVVGNAMVILVFGRERRLRRRTNYYIVSLAVADLLVGLFGIPFAILAEIGLPRNLYACLFTLSTLIVLCTISIFCLVAVSVDRYWAILYPMGYSRNVRTKTALVIISVCWVAGSLLGFLPLFGWHANKSTHLRCYFVQVMEYDFLVFLYFTTIVTPSIVLAAFYAHIYRVVVKQLRQIVTMNPGAGGSCKSGRAETGNGGGGSGGGTMLRVLGAAQKREVKATQNLAIIVLFFIVCWMPLYTINCIEAFCTRCRIEKFWVNCCIVLSHLNSAVNPLLYAYHLKDFRAALKSLIFTVLGIKETNPANDNYYKPSIVSHSQRKLSYPDRRLARVHSDHFNKRDGVIVGTPEATAPKTVIHDAIVGGDRIFSSLWTTNDRSAPFENRSDVEESSKSASSVVRPNSEEDANDGALSSPEASHSTRRHRSGSAPESRTIRRATDDDFSVVDDESRRRISHTSF